MQTQTIFKAGNSYVVAIPKYIVRDLKLTVGKSVTVDTTAGGDAILISPTQEKRVQSKAKKAQNAEFQQWLKSMLEEDKELLDELAHR